MMKYQYGSFEIQSTAMLHILEELEKNCLKKYFIIVGDVGTGKSTMLSYVNKRVFSNTQKNISDEAGPVAKEAGSAILTTSREDAYEVIRLFDKQETHIIEMPNLLDRKADISGFAGFFIEVLNLMSGKESYKLTEKAVEKLLHHNWPGNFHELESVLELAFEEAQKSSARPLIEPSHILLGAPAKSLEFSLGQKLDEVERKYILQTLYFVHQNRTRAAEILGISIRTLRNKINQYRQEGYL